MTSWRWHAACRFHDPAVFLDGDRDAAALEICQACRPRYECLAEALDYDARGVWGGMADDDRARLRRPEPDDRLCPMAVAHPAGWRGGQVPKPKPVPVRSLPWDQVQKLVAQRRRFLFDHVDLDRPFRAAAARRVAEELGIEPSTVSRDVRALRKMTKGMT